MSFESSLAYMLLSMVSGKCLLLKKRKSLKTNNPYCMFKLLWYLQQEDQEDYALKLCIE